MSVLQSLKDAKGIDDLSALLGYKPQTLSFILYKIPKTSKYTVFHIPKKGGGVREISAPIEHLKVLQKHLANALYACREEIGKGKNLKPISHGFRKGLSIVTNAKPHHRRRYVLNLDLKDFFPTFNFGRVRGYFIKNNDFQLDPSVATLIAQIACSDCGLPQGSPCSPVIADMLAHILDVRLAQLARKQRVTYTRYADDLTFSTNQKTFPTALAVQDPLDGGKWDLGKSLADRIAGADLIVNPDKTRMQCRMSRQLVTGLTVNEKVNVRPEYYRTTRAMCDNLFKTGEYAIEQPLVVNATPTAPATPPADSDSQTGETGSASKTKVTTKSLGPVSGRLAHIHHVKDQIDLRKEVDKRKDKTAFRKLYYRFLFYRAFVALDRPLILAEGKTDNIYLTLAIRHSPAFQPKLGLTTADGFKHALRFFNQENKTHHIMQLEGGTGNFKALIIRYKDMVASFGHRPLAHPVIMLIDNDEGAKEIFSLVHEKFGHTISMATDDGFYPLTDNLYLVKTPHVGRTHKTCIENLFDPAVLETEYNGKKFNPNATAASNEYGKAKFADHVVKPTAPALNWIGFGPLLQRFVDVIDHYDVTKPAAPPTS